MNNPLQDYLSALMTRAEQNMPKFRPHCCECSQPITGESYNGRCGPCARDIARAESVEIERNWKEMNQ